MTSLTLIATAIVLLPPPSGASPARAQGEPPIERFTVTDARDNQTAPWVDGRWILYEHVRRSRPHPDAHAHPWARAKLSRCTTSLVPCATGQWLFLNRRPPTLDRPLHQMVVTVR